MTSRDGVGWSAWQRLATIANGHYQISGVTERKAASAFNYHPKEGGLNYRTNLYYVETRDFGETWTIAHWTGIRWDIQPVTTSDNNYDMGSLFIEKDGAWSIIAPTETGPQPYNPGGEMAIWASKEKGMTWKRVKQITHNSKRNHNYARACVHAHRDFYALWADGHGRKPSESNLYFCNRAGDVYALPRRMSDSSEKPELVEPIARADAEEPPR